MVMKLTSAGAGHQRRRRGGGVLGIAGGPLAGDGPGDALRAGQRRAHHAAERRRHGMPQRATPKTTRRPQIDEQHGWTRQRAGQFLVPPSARVRGPAAADASPREQGRRPGPTHHLLEDLGQCPGAGAARQEPPGCWIWTRTRVRFRGRARR